MEVLSLMIRLLLVVDLVAAQLMVVVRAWQLVAVAVDRAVAVVNFQFPPPQATSDAGTGAGAGTGNHGGQSDFNVAGVKDTEGHRPET